MARSTARLRSVPEDGSASSPSVYQTPPTPIGVSPVSLYLAGLDPTSRTTVRRRLDAIADALRPGTDATTYPWETGTYDQAAAVKAQLASRLHWSNVNAHLAAWKGVLRVYWQCGLMTTDAYHRAVDIKPFRGKVLPTGRHITDEEFRELFNHLAQDDSPRGRRDLALFAVARTTGARREELTLLDLDDLDLPNLKVRIQGKGRRERESALAPWVRSPLERYLAIRGTLEGPLFTVLKRNGQPFNPPKRISLPGMQHILKHRLGIHDLKGFCWHDLRRSLVTDLLDDGADLEAVMHQVGHSNPKTTLRYSRRGEEKLRQVVRSVPSPFGGEE
jgi:integrase